MSKWIRISFHSHEQTPIVKVSDDVCSNMLLGAVAGDTHAVYPIESYAGMLGGGQSMPGSFVVHWEDITCLLVYDISPYPVPDSP